MRLADPVFTFGGSKNPTTPGPNGGCKSSCTGVRVLAVSLQRPSRPSRPTRPEHPQRIRASTVATPRDGFQPVWLAELGLSEPAPRVRTTVRAADASHRRARVLVRREGHPVGVVETDLDEGGLSQAEVARICADFDRRPAPAHRRTGRTGRGLPGGLTATVVVATHNRSTGLGRCLDSLRAMDCPTPPIVVVDNAPASTATADLLRRDYPEVTYLREEVAGLARAHNRGLALVETPVVAFTDDDVVVNRESFPSLVAPFAEDEEVGCVTGLIWPAELDTPAQALIDAKGGFAKGFERRRFHQVTARPEDPLFPYTAGRFGSGANVAFRTTALRGAGRLPTLPWEPAATAAAETTWRRSSTSSPRVTRWSTNRLRSSTTTTPASTPRCARQH